MDVRQWKHLFLTAGVLAVAGCAAAPYLLPAGIEFARNLLVIAANNHGTKYSEELGRLIVNLSQPYVTPAAGAAPYPATVAAQTSYPAPYPGPGTPPAQSMAGTTPAYPGYPGVPTSPYPAPAANPYPTPPAGPYPQTASPYPSPPTSPYPSAPASPYPPAYGSAPQYPPQAGTPYTPPTGRASVAEAAGVEVTLLHERAGARGREVVPLNDGDVLRDNLDDAHAGDKFRLVLRPLCDCWAYVVAVDGSGLARTLFPAAATRSANPLKKSTEYSFPEGQRWFALDQVKGVETFYVVVSPTPRQDLESSIARVAASETPAARGVERVAAPALITRGARLEGAGRDVLVRSETGQPASVPAVAYAAARPGESVTVTRWFRHE